MHSFKIALLAVAASLVSAQVPDLSQLPPCALDPAVAALGSTGCATTDFKCICSATSFITSLEPAIEAACSAADLAKAESFAVSLCAAYGVTLNLGPSSTSSVPSTTTMSSSYTTPTSSAAGVSTVYVTVPCSTSTSSSAVVAATPASNVTVSATLSSKPSVFTGAATAGYVSCATLFGAVAAVMGALML